METTFHKWTCVTPGLFLPFYLFSYSHRLCTWNLLPLFRLWVEGLYHFRPITIILILLPQSIYFFWSPNYGETKTAFYFTNLESFGTSFSVITIDANYMSKSRPYLKSGTHIYLSMFTGKINFTSYIFL